MTRLHHLALGARDVEGVAKFYCHFGGLAERARHFDEAGHLRSIWLELDGAILMIERTTASPLRVDGVGSGPFLLAFTVDASERARVEAELRTLGHSIDARTDFTTYTRDPEGNRVGFSHYPEAPG